MNMLFQGLIYNKNVSQLVPWMAGPHGVTYI